MGRRKEWGESTCYKYISTCTREGEGRRAGGGGVWGEGVDAGRSMTVNLQAIQV